MMFEKIVQTGICTLLQIPCESAVAFCKNPSKGDYAWIFARNSERSGDVAV